MNLAIKKESKNIFSFLPDGGETGKLIRSIDWSRTSLGPPSQWPQSLKMSLSICMGSRFPMLIWWGREMIMLYNDGYREMLGATKHPALGEEGRKIWPEIWHIIGPMLDGVLRHGRATWSENQLLTVDRYGYSEETYFTFSYSPIQDNDTVVGIFTAVSETTEQVLAERRLDLLRMFGEKLAEARTVEAACELSGNILERGQRDVPYSLTYLFQSKSNEFVLANTTGLEDNSASPARLAAGTKGTWPLEKVLINKGPYILEDAGELYENLPGKPWPESSHTAVLLPLMQSDRQIMGVLVAGISPRRKLDNAYLKFLNLVAGQITTTIANARAYEEERKRAEALAEIDRAKTTFFGNVSHEFRTPLTLMLGPVNDLLNNSQSTLPIQAAETLSLVQRNGYRLQKLVNTLLEFSRIEAGRVQASFQSADMSKLTADLASNFRSAIEKAGVDLEIDCPTLQEETFIDPEMWEKIVLNLVSNAFKFTFEGRISVSTRVVDSTAQLIVSDTGIGIAPQHLPRLFERFHRVPQARSRTFEGSGIGLALVNELVKLHGGTIDVASEEGKGTTFTVSIPTGKSHLPEDHIKSAPSANQSAAGTSEVFLDEALRWLPDEGLHHISQIQTRPSRENGVARPVVLLADDNADMRNYIKSLLNDFCDVHLVANGRAALEAARTLEPELILSDVMMPEMDGFELLSILRNDPALRSIPVILLSARAGEEAKVEGFNSGADDYLTKPFSRAELIARVNSNLQLSRVRKEVQQAVRLSEAHLRALITATSDVVYRMSPDWEVMRQLDGRSFLQNTGEPIREWQRKYIPPSDQKRVSEAIAEAIRSKGIFQLEHKVIQADGTVGWTFSRAIPILDKNGDVIEWFGAASDITVRKIYENELESRVDDRTRQLNMANAALQNSNEDLQQFAHVASHDLKEPVRKIKTFAYRLWDESRGTMSPKAKVYIEKVLAAAERMSTMIEGVLTYSSLNGSENVAEQINLNEIIEEIKNDLEILIQQKKARIESEDLPAVEGGRVLIYQLFYNLIYNALKFSHPERTPVVTIRSIDISKHDTMYHRIAISDNGIGFESSQREKIFETFTRLNSKDKYDGTGLGLALCRKIVKRHGGSISASSAVGKGATFTIELPYHPSTEKQNLDARS